MKKPLSATEQDFLTEMLRIGIDKALVALSHFCAAPVDLKTPMKSAADEEALQLYQASASLMRTRVDFYGDLNGTLYFLLQGDQMQQMTDLIEASFFRQFGGNSKPEPEDIHEWKSSMIEELANAFAGQFFAALYTSTKLDVAYKVPEFSVSTFQYVLEEIDKKCGAEGEHLTIIFEISIGHHPVEMTVLMAFSGNISRQLQQLPDHT